MTGLPHSEETERAVLAGVLLKPALLHAVADAIGVGDFHLERHQLIFRAITRVAADSLDIDTRSVQLELERTNEFEAAGGLAYLIGLDLDLPDLGAVVGYAEKLRELSARRHAVKVAGEVTQGILSGALGPDEVAERYIAAARVVEDAQRRGNTARTVAQILPDIEPPEAYIEVPGLRTGFPLLDAYVGGLVGGRLIVVGGRPGNGKSSFVGVVAFNVARAGGSVLFTSLEMSDRDVLRRMISSECGVAYRALERGRMSRGMWDQYRDGVARTAGFKLAIDSTPAQSLGAICAQARRAKRSPVGLDLLVVDYLQLLRGADPRVNRDQQVGEMSRRFKELSLELDIPVLLLSQLNRESARAGQWRPQVHQMRESGSIEQDADQIIFTCIPANAFGADDPEQNEWEGKAVLILAKNRHGEANVEIHCGWDGSTYSMVPDLSGGAR